MFAVLCVCVKINLYYPLPLCTPPPVLGSLIVTGCLQHLYSKASKKKRCVNPRTKITKMATPSLSLELLAAIQVPNLRPMPAYLSEADALTVAEFLQKHYATFYQIDVSNMHWGGETHAGHLFDIFCNFQALRDSVKTRIEMISFVTSNYRRYSWDCDLYLRMNNLTLNNWINKMTYWGNCGDALAIYAMSDMYGVHSCVVTKFKLWTTVANTFRGTDIDVLKLCQVKLVYLGDHKYGKLVPKTYVGQPCM